MMPIQARRPGNPGPPERQLVIFGVANVVYGVPIESVREVVSPQPVIDLPHAPSPVVGVADYRGEVVPVIDLRARFGLPPLADLEARRRAKWIMMDVAVSGEHPRLVAAVVDLVHSVFATREPLRSPPLLGDGDDSRGILGVLSRATSAQGKVGARSPSPAQTIAHSTALATALATTTATPSRGHAEAEISKASPRPPGGLVFVLDLGRLRALTEPLDLDLGLATAVAPGREGP